MEHAEQNPGGPRRDPLDELDLLLGRRSSAPWSERWSERWRTGAADRRPWLIAGALIATVTVVVFVIRNPAPVAVELPRAVPSGSSLPSAEPTGSVSAAPPGASSTSSAVAAGAVVHVAGAVVHPGLVTLPAGARAADAVAAAGGPRPDADLERVNLAAPLADGARLYVPAIGQIEVPVVVPSPGSGGVAPDGTAADPAAPVDVNSATVEQLDTLPGVGPSTAAAIVAYRTEHGRFASVEELQDVRGIGPAKFEALRSLVVAG